MKARIRKTGEIVYVIAYSQCVSRDHDADYVSYIDSKGIEHDRERGLNYYWDFEPIEDNSENKPINWEQRRYEIAKAALQGLLAYNEELNAVVVRHRDTFEEDIAHSAVKYADALIAELKESN